MADANKHVTASMRKTCEGCGEAGKKTNRGLCKDCGKISRKGIKLLTARRHSNISLPPRLTDIDPRRIRPTTCRVCAEEYTPARGDRITACSRECGLIWTGHKSKIRKTGGRVSVTIMRLKSVVWYDQPPTPVFCHVCKSGYVRSSVYQRRCSTQCDKVHEERVKQVRRSCPARRRAKAKRRALKRGAGITSGVDPFVVFKRDAWKCQICGCSTPKRLRGLNKSNSPELDHIVPISKGGQHTYKNTQCLCRSCNSAKSDKVLGQLLLFG